MANALAALRQVLEVITQEAEILRATGEAREDFMRPDPGRSPPTGYHMKRRDVDACPLCGCGKKAGTTTFTADLGFGIVVIRNVPATVCSQCGADWIADDVAARIEELVDDARKRRLQVEEMSLA